MNWKRVLLLMSVLLMSALVACNDDAAEEPSARSSALAASEPGAEVAGGEALQDGDDGDDEDAVVTDACAYSQGYWKNHPAAWDVEQLTVGDTTYDQEDLLAILETAPQGDATYILIHQLIAAELNLENDAEAIEAIEQANDWLAEHPLGTDPDAEREEAIMLAETLDDYNNGLLAAEACDAVAAEEEPEDDDLFFDEDDDVENDEFDDEVEGERCTGANPHPHGQDLAARYEVEYDEIMALFCDGYGFGEIEIAFNLADESELSVEEITEMRAEGMGWGQIRKELGAQPGLGNGKPNPGNGGNPPGLDKDNRGRGNDKDNPGRGNSKSNPGRGNNK